MFLEVTATFRNENAMVFGISAPTTKGDLHLDLKLQNRRACCQKLLEVIPENAVVFFSNFYLLVGGGVAFVSGVWLLL